jgi:riboflavin kinase/FMN adenylyltransferase
VYSAFENLPRADYLVTVGTFDGMHLGHQHLIAQALARAAHLGVRTLVLTFEPVPAMVLRPETFVGRLTTAEQKIDLLCDAGDLSVVVMPFTRELSCMSAEEFLETLVRQVAIRELWVGEEFALGKDRQGTIETLLALGQGFGFAVNAVPRVTRDGGIVSSSRIRTLVANGNVAEANGLLGRRFRVEGVVCEGAKLGRTIGYPTANVMPPEDLVPLADGIYASLARLNGEQRPAMTYIGTRPALNPGNRVIETHIFDFDADIYGEVLTTEFVERLRPDSNFDSVDALIAQMQQDERQARSILLAIA